MAEEEKKNEELQKTEEHRDEPDNIEEHSHTEEPHYSETEHHHDSEDHKAPHDETEKPKKKFSLKEFVKSTKGKVTLAVTGAIVVALVVIFAVPATRYGALGMFIKKDVTLTLVDSKTNKPVSKAQVDIPGQSAVSDNQGKVQFRGVPVGPQKVTIKKKYYKGLTQTIDVWITKTAEPEKLSVEATGRQVPVTVTSKISGQPVAKATVTAQESSAITDDKGEAVLIMPADKTTLTGTVKADGFNDLAINVTNTEQIDSKNIFAVTPTGKIYFLSKRTGKINVMKSDLDGGNAQTVVQGTGKEEEGQTILLASRDWKYQALLAKRDGDKAKLYLIDTSNDKLSVIDEGNADFTLYGWTNHTFTYRVSRNAVASWKPKQDALKSYDVAQNKLTTLDETDAQGTSDFDRIWEDFGDIALLGDEVAYTKNWTATATKWSDLNNKKATFNSVHLDGSNKKLIKDFGISASTQASSVSVSLRSYEPKAVYVGGSTGSEKFYKYEDGKLADAPDINQDNFYRDYPTYLLSPSGKQTFWSESRDGKNTFLIGDEDGANGKEVASLSDYRQYGWYTDDYLLVSKNNSELYILDKNHPEKALKITDYHKPSYNFFGYGGGYGGF